MKRFLVVFSKQWEVIDTHDNCKVAISDPSREVITEIAEDMNRIESIKLVAL